MINLNTTAGPATSSLTGTPETAPAGDFLAVFSALVADLSTEATQEGTGLLLPGSPLLEANPLDAQLATELEALLDADLVAGELVDAAATDDDEPGIPWPAVQALAALFAQPTPAAAAAEGDGGVDLVGAVSPSVTGDGSGGSATIGLEAAGAADADSLAPGTDGGSTPMDETAMGGTDDGDTMPADTKAAARPATLPVGVSAPDAEGTNADATTGAIEATESAEPAEPAAGRRETPVEMRPHRTEASDSPAESAAPISEPRGAGETVRDRGPLTSTAVGIARVLDALDRLELAPPPRQVTLDLGDVRVRVAMEDGGVRMQLLGEQRDGGREFLRAAEEALRERGFDLTGDDRGEHAGHQRPDLAPPRPERPVGRSTRSTDPTSTGVRPGVHL
ncbi:MAG: hypothetical protein WD378_10515 [Egicoccus sp.]